MDGNFSFYSGMQPSILFHLIKRLKLNELLPLRALNHNFVLYNSGLFICTKYMFLIIVIIKY